MKTFNGSKENCADCGVLSAKAHLDQCAGGVHTLSLKSKHKMVTFSTAEGLFKLKPSVHVRLVVSGVAFYADVKDVCLGFSTQMNAVEKAQNELARLMGLGEPCNGLAGTWDGVQVQIDVVPA